MIFHENCLPADNSHEISYLIFFRKLGKMWHNLSSAAVVVGALRFKGNHLGNRVIQTAVSYCILAELLQHYTLFTLPLLKSGERIRGYLYFFKFFFVTFGSKYDDFFFKQNG